MHKINNNIDFLKNINIEYCPDKLISKSDLNKYILNGTAIKVKTISTCDGKNVIVNDRILKFLRDLKVDYKRLTLEQLNRYNIYKASDYVFISDLLKDAKSGIITYIEILDESYKNQKEKEIVNLITTLGLNSIISSPNKKVMKFVKKKAPNVVRGYKFESYDNDDLKLSRSEIKKIKNVKVPFGIKPDFIEYDINLMPNEKLKGMKTISYLIDTDAKLNKASVYSFARLVKNSYME